MLRETQNYMDEATKEQLIKQGGKVTHADLLVYHKRAQEKKRKIKRKRKKNSIVQQCTFKPKTIDYNTDSIRKQAPFPGGD